MTNLLPGPSAFGNCTTSSNTVLISGSLRKALRAAGECVKICPIAK
jgi:hypothetical protein